MSRPARQDDRGAATVLAVSLCGLLLVLGLGLGVVTAVVVDLRRAQAAADLAALAGAVEAARGGEGCAEASRVAAGNGASLVGCTVAGREVTLTVEVAGPRWLGLAADPRARARAGPA